MKWLTIPLATLCLLAAAGCGGSGSSTSTTPIPNSLTLSFASSTLTMAQGASGSVSVTLARQGSVGSVTLSVSGLPAHAIAAIQQPGANASGSIQIAAASTAFSGTYPLTVKATDGTTSGSANLSLAITIVPAITGPFHWSSTGPLISAIPDATHPIVSVKDPSVVYYNNSWHVFATTADTSGTWSMEYLNFTDWTKAATAKPYYMGDNPAYGNHAAPEVFFFRPQNKWYLISEWGPQYSTNDNIAKPQNWTAPQNLFDSSVPGVTNWLDYWVICDSANCYFFCTDDGGHFFRAQTTIQNFPAGFGQPVLVMSAANAGDLFEASNTYKLKGTNQYLTLVEAIGSKGRYFRAFIADRLDGDWTPLPQAATEADPFLGFNDVGWDAGVSAWTVDFSHGEMVRDGYDETLTVDPTNMQFLYQGVDPTKTGVDYSQLPWQLGLARQN